MHGSDGRDLTLCVTSIAQVILNPDCRTVRGFEALIEREWLQVGNFKHFKIEILKKKSLRISLVDILNILIHIS